MQPSIDSSLSIGGGKEDGSVLKQKLHENEKKLTETKLQYLSSAHQIDQMKDEMSLLKVRAKKGPAHTLHKSHVAIKTCLGR